MNRIRTFMLGILVLGLVWGNAGTVWSEEPVPPTEEPKIEEKKPEEKPEEMPAPVVTDKAPETKPEEKPEEKAVETSAPAVTDKAPETKPEGEEPKEEKKYETFMLQSVPLKIDVEADAVLMPGQFQEIQIKTKQWTTLKVKSAVSHGAMVRKGDKLVTLDMEDYEEKVKTSRRDLELARLTLLRARTAYRLQKKTAAWDAIVTRRSREETVDKFEFTKKWDYDLNVRNMEMMLGTAEFTLKSQKKELEQLQKMYAENDLTETTEEIMLERQRRVVEATDLQLYAAKGRYEWAKTRSLPRFIRGEKETLERALATIDAAIENLAPNLKTQDLNMEAEEAKFRELEKDFRELEADRTALECLSPTDGMVLYGVLDNGKWSDFAKSEPLLKEDQTLTANKTFLTICQLGSMELAMAFAEKDYSNLAVGKKGFFRPTAYPESELPMELTFVAAMPMPDKYRSTAKVTLDPSLKLWPGMGGKATLFAVRKTNALLVPATAVGREEDLSRYVYVLDKEKKEPAKRPVKLGKKSGEKWEIIDGLEAGMEILKDLDSVEKP